MAPTPHGAILANVVICRVRKSVRPVGAVLMTTDQILVYRARSSASTSGCPGLRPRSDRHHQLSLPYKGGSRSLRRDDLDQARTGGKLRLGQGGPDDAGGLVGHGDGDPAGRAALKQARTHDLAAKPSVLARRFTVVAPATSSL